MAFSENSLAMRGNNHFELDGRTWLRFLCVLAVMAAAWAIEGRTLRAQSLSAPASELPNWARQSRWTLGFQLTYGLENNIPHNISHVNMLIAAPQVGFIVWDSPHSRLPMNRFEILSEGIFGSALHPGGHLLGHTLMFRFDFKPVHRVIPFFDAGSAALHTSLDEQAPEISGHTQFLSQGGVGLQYFYKPRRAFVIEYRYFHMSNAGLQQPNHGFNGNMLSVGYRWLLPLR